jgi:H(+)-translocating pyrophosphatase
VIIEGISVGSYSTIGPVLIIASTIIAVRALSGSAFGIALASTGLLSTLAITLATDAYGPVADNAGGIAEMSHMPPHVRNNTDTLDALGNTTAAVGKGFAVGSAVLTAVSLLTTYTVRVGISDSLDPINSYYFIPGVLVGAMLPYAFAALTMGAVASAAGSVVVEVRRQLSSIAGLREGKEGVMADHTGCVAMVTGSALYLMVPPAALVILSPLIFGIGLGPDMLAGLLLGAITSGFVLGGMMNAAGGAWDNAKKLNEKDGQKGSFKHKSTVVGDTVGDPFKDTSGPAINIQIKLMSYISVVLSPVFKNQVDYWWVSLIIIGVLLIGAPIYIWMCPASIKTEKTAEVVAAARDGKKEEKSAEMTPVDQNAQV